MAELMISVGELRNRFDEYIHRIKLGEAIIITKYGKPVAEFIPAKRIQTKRKHMRADRRRKKRS